MAFLLEAQQLWLGAFLGVFFKGRSSGGVLLHMAGTRRQLSPLVAVEKSVDIVQGYLLTKTLAEGRVQVFGCKDDTLPYV